MGSIDSQQQEAHWFLQPNPLLDGIPTYKDMDSFVSRLAFAPLQGLDVSTLSFIDRNNLLVCEKTPLEPTTQSVRAALTWYGMFQGGLQVRNPTLPQAARHYWSVLSAVDQGAKSLPRTPTSGISVQIVKGPTGTAKTVTVKQFCSMLGPQRIDRGANPDAGWKAIRQLVYLYTTLAHDGTRGGFLTGILLEMDRVLETNYAIDLPKRFKTIERLAVATIGRMLAHYTGIVFVDEGQLRNLMLSDHADLMQLFLLSLMNSGIPLVLIGNELAFSWIDYSQDLSRLHMTKQEYFHPVGAFDHPDVEADWDALFAGISDYYVLPRPVENMKACKDVLRRCSGGVARLGLTLWCTAQHDRLLSGGDFLRPQDIQAAYDDSAFDKLRALACGFAKRLPELLLGFPDVAAEYYAKHWGKPIGAATTDAKSEESSKPPGNTAPPEEKSATGKRRPSGRTKLKAEQTRKKNRDKARQELAEQLSPDDMRRDGIKQVQLAGLATTRAKIEQGS